MGNILNILVENYFGKNVKDYRIPNGIHNYLPKSNNSKITMVKTGPFFSNDILDNFEVNMVDLNSKLDVDKKYLYLIELNTPKGLYSSFHSIPKKVIDLVNQDRCYVILLYIILYMDGIGAAVVSFVVFFFFALLWLLFFPHF